MGKKSKNKHVLLNVPKAGSILPQNIRLVGEKINEGNALYIHQKTYRQIKKFVQNKTTDESGGILLGNVSVEAGKTSVFITGFIEAKHTEATTTTLTFTHKTWEHFHSEIDKRYKGMKIVGWIHTHPDFGIFLSEYDRFVHENFFKEPYQVAYVVDTVKSIEGFYNWENKELVKCSSFFIYDDAGKQIADPTNPNNRESLIDYVKPQRTIKQLVIYSATVLIMLLMLANLFNQHKQITSLQNQLEQRNIQLVTLYNENETLKQQLLDNQSSSDKQD